MSDIDPIPLLFEGVEPTETPELVFVVGQPGSGANRLTHTILSEHSHNIASVAAENLAAFNPDFLDLAAWRPLDAPAAFAPQVAECIGRTLDHARETRRSLLFSTSINSPAPAIATAQAFEAEGFTTRIVVVGTPRAESLLAAASRYLNARRLRLPARFTDHETHARGWLGTHALVQDAEATPSVGRLTILNRHGDHLFDATRDQGFTGATAAIESAHFSPVSVLEGARWFGELRAITDFARRAREMASPVTEVLIELHELAMSDVLPNMPVPMESSFAVEQVSRLRGEVESLSLELPAPPTVDLFQPSGPIVAPAPSRGGPSL